MARPKKGDRLVYTGKYAHEMPEVFGPVDPVPPYPPGEVVAFRTNRGVRCVTVLLDKAEGETEDLYADWPIEDVAHA